MLTPYLSSLKTNQITQIYIYYIIIFRYWYTPDDRLLELETYFRELSENHDEPTIVLGDFNEGARGKSCRFLEQRQHKDAIQEFDPHTNTWEWPMFQPLFSVPWNWKWSAKFDHIFYSQQHLKCLGAKVLHEQGESDHFPCVADFCCISNKK